MSNIERVFDVAFKLTIKFVLVVAAILGIVCLIG